ncbi:uncharacterized protein LOC142663885 [Rhinoderma darwinii]|uniref:uncharacterized protein LOC142663885 n=1 Tax=Rhinoderma darwinii TaxID=43563 RepID=UPI003F67B005
MFTVEAKIARCRAVSLGPSREGATEIAEKSLEDCQTQPSVENLVGGRSQDIRFFRFEKDLEKRLQQRRAAPRMLSQEICLSLAQKLLLSIILQLEGKSRSLPIQETALQFFTGRYVNRDISAYGLVDFCVALKRDSSDNKVLRLLRSVLEGDLDPAVLGYVLLRSEMVTSPLTDMDQFRQYVHKIYPFLEETEQERLLLDFTGYSQRSVSPPSVLGFILQMILQHQEPLIRECEDVLSTHVETRAGHLTAGELSEALTELCPLLNRSQIESSIQRSVTASCRSLIPLLSAAHIAAFHLESEKRRGNKAADHMYREEAGRSGNKSSESEDVRNFQFLHNLLHLLKSHKG